MDFSWNKHAEKKFEFEDHFLVSCIRSKKDPQMLEFFKLLSLCHTVMVEHKEGEETKTIINEIINYSLSNTSMLAFISELFSIPNLTLWSKTAAEIA